MNELSNAYLVLLFPVLLVHLISFIVLVGADSVGVFLLLMLFSHNKPMKSNCPHCEMLTQAATYDTHLWNWD